MVLLALVWLGCAPTSCESMAAGGGRDRCLYDEVVPGNTEHAPPVAEATRLAGLIDDDVIRDAAVQGWVRDHRAKVASAEGEQLCDLLKGEERSACSRSLFAIHLSR